MSDAIRRVVAAATTMLACLSLQFALAIPAAADSGLQSSLASYLAGQDGTYGVAVRNLNTGETVLINADREFQAASTYKVLVMYRVYQQLERGALTADTPVTITADDADQGGPSRYQAGDTPTVADALESMMTVSDNAAAWALTDAVGGWGAVTSAAGEIGMGGVHAQDDYYYATPTDMLTFFQALAGGGLVDASASQRMVRLLERQQENDRIPALLPSVPVAHKTGELPGVRNDIGIVYGPGATYVIVVFGEGADDATLVNTIARVSRMVYDHFD